MIYHTLNQYLNHVDNLWQTRHGEALARLLSCRDIHITSKKLLDENISRGFIERVLEPPLSRLVELHLGVARCLGRTDFIEAHHLQASALQTFLGIFKDQVDENWALPVLYALCLDMRLISSRAKTQLAGANFAKFKDPMERAAESLMGCFRACAADNRSSEETTKRWAMLYIVNQLFKVYFRISKLDLCKPLVRAIESSPLREQFSIAQQVTYRYYVGCKVMFDGDYKKADSYLTFAFEKCHRSAWRNKRLVLLYLIPVKMLRGYLPSRAVLEKYSLLEFWPIVDAVRTGQVRLLQAVLQQQEAFFIGCGIYLILEKLKIVAYRNLLKQVHRILNTHQIPMDALWLALKLAEGDQVEYDEVVCIVSNLIYDGKIKGYISLQHKKLVVSKQNPFPQLSSLA